MDTSQQLYQENPPQIKNFDPGTTSGSYYQVGDFFGEFQEPHLSVMVPVTLNMQVEGYVAMHLPASKMCIRDRPDSRQPPLPEPASWGNRIPARRDELECSA